MPDYYQEDANKLNKDYLIKNDRFLRDATQFLMERKDYDPSELSSAEDIYSLFVSHMRDADVNELTAVNDLAHISDIDDERKMQIGKLYSTWDRMESGGTGFWNAVRDYGLGVATAPSTYVGLVTGGAGKLVAFGGAQAAKFAARKATVGFLRAATTKALPKGLVARKALKGAVGSGLTEGTAGAIRGSAAQLSRIHGSLGEREFDIGAVALETGIGLGAGTVLGAGVGALTGKRQMKALGLIDKATEAKATRLTAAQAEVQKEILTPTTLDTSKVGKISANTVTVSVDEQTSEFVKAVNHVRKIFGSEPLDAGAVKDGLKNFDKRLISPVDPDKKLEESLQFRLAGATVDILKKAMTTADDTGEPILKKLELDFEKDRITTVISKILNGLPDQTAKSEFISNILQKYDINIQQFTSLYTAELSNAGRVLGLQSAVVRNLSNAFAELADVPVSVRKADPTDPSKTINTTETVQLTEDATAFVTAMQSGANATHLFRRLTRGAVSGIKEWDKFTKGMMTIQPATTMRNLENATVRSAIYMFTNILEGGLDAGTALIRKGMRPNDPAVQKAFRDGLNKSGKSVSFVRNLFDNSEAKALVHLFSKEMPDEYVSIFRAMGDIETLGGRGGALTGLARKLNGLNTFLDNSFKRAVFVSELAQRVGGRKVLLELSENGRFNEIATKHIQDSMDEALDFTYQTRFRGKGKTEYGVWSANSAAAKLIDVFSTPVVGSGFVPYPRFIASMVKHNFQYAPIVGMLPLERLGRRTAKAAGVQKGVKPKGLFLGEGRSVNNIIAQQAVGFSLLWGAMQIRASQGPSAEWYELKKLPIPTPSSRGTGIDFKMRDIGKGRYTNAKAFYGVYAPSMLVADVLLKSLGFWDTPEDGKPATFDPQKLIANDENRARMETMAREAMTKNLNSKFYRDLMEASFGSQFRVGQGLFLLDSIAGAYGAGDVQEQKTREMLAKQISTFVGNYLVRPVVPAGFAKDVLGTVDPSWKVIPDRGDINPFLMGAYGDAVRNVLGIVTRPLPIKEGKLFGAIEIQGYERPAVSPETTLLLTTEGGVQKQIAGIGGGKFKTPLNEEMTRLNIDKPWAKFKRYKAPMLNRIAAKISGEKVERRILDYVQTNQDYLQAHPNAQKVKLNDFLEKIRTKVGEEMKQRIDTDFEIQKLPAPNRDQLMSEFLKIEYSRFRSDERKEVERQMKLGNIEGIGKLDITKAKGTQARRAYQLAIEWLKTRTKIK